MPESARVQSVDDIKAFRSVLLKFAEEAQTSLISAETELYRTLHWLQGPQTIHWQDTVRKCTEKVKRCKEAIREKRMYKDSTGAYPSAQEEEKALRVAQRRLEEAEQKLAATQKYSRHLAREVLLYKGQVQRFSTVAQVDLPQAVAWLDRIVVKLQGYAELLPDDGRLTEAMALAMAEDVPPPPPPPAPPAQAEGTVGDSAATVAEADAPTGPTSEAPAAANSPAGPPAGS
jgi:hypothetical protein